MHTLRRRSLLVVALLIACFASRTASAQTAPRLDYTVAVADAGRHLFHLKIQISNIPGKTVDISLPAWTPGWYTIQPYAANVIKLQANANGKRLPLHAVDKQTYRIESESNRALTVDYD